MPFFDNKQWRKTGWGLVEQVKTTVRKHSTRRTLVQVITEPPDTGKLIIDMIPQGGAKSTKLGNYLGLSPKQSLAKKADQKSVISRHKPQQLKRSLVVSVSAATLSIAGLVSPVLWLVSGVGLLYSGLNVTQRTYQQLKQRQTTVDMLVCFTILGCVVQGSFLVGNIATTLFFGSLWMVNLVKDNAHKHLANVFGQAPQFVWILVDDTEVSIPFSQLQSGHVVIVETGETIPADGVIIEGMATIDQHVLTGEARPVERGPNEKVFASTVVLSGRIYFRVERAGAETTVAKIESILDQTTDFKSKTVLRAEQLANKTVLPTLFVTFVALPFIGPMGALGIFNAHFKRKLTLVTPISILNFFSIASKQGALIKDGLSLDLLYEVDTIVFDKTGTLTEEQPYVGQIHVCAEYDENQVLQLATAAEYKQSHPIAKAIIEEAEKRGLDIPEITGSEYEIGYGLQVKVEDKIIQVGSNRFMEKSEIALPVSIVTAQAVCYEQGYSLIMVAVNETLVGAIELRPTIRAEAQAVIQQLKQHPHIKETYIISGDNEIPTRKLSQQLGIDHYFAETLPEEKAALIEHLQQQGKRVCYIGDGINDAIALKKAHVSISLKGASTIATDTAQIILLDEGLQHLNFLFELAEDFHLNVNINFGVVLVPTILGIGGVFLLGFGLAQTLPLNLLGLGVGIGTTMYPRLKYRHLLAQ